MEKLERIIELSQSISSMRERRGQLAEELADVDRNIEGLKAELSKYVPDLEGANGTSRTAAPGASKGARSTGYMKGSVAYRMLQALVHAPQGLSGSELTSAVGAENKQIHAMLSRMVPDGHVSREAGEGRSSRYVATAAGRTALANAK